MEIKSLKLKKQSYPRVVKYFIITVTENLGKQ